MLKILALTVMVAGAPVTGSRDQLLVDANWLKKHINDRNIVLLHVGDRKEYDREHIPGARFIGMQDVAAPHDMSKPMDHSKELILELPTAEAARAKLQALGISDNSRIIVYYGNDWVSPSTRIIFTLNWLGLGDRTSLLDGGMKSWKAAGGSVTAEVPTPTAGKLSAKPLKNSVVDVAFVRANLENPKFAIIDARTRNFYDGVSEGTRPGHIKGAGSLPFVEVAGDGEIWKSPEELKALFARAGYKQGQTIIAYCHIGQQATAVVFAARTLGYPVFLYDGSYTQWELIADAPIEKGAPAKAAQ